MLSALRIKNLGLVADLTIELQAGFNVITGETGAGKSMLMGALSLVLGERADRGLIRAGSDSCMVEAVFDLPSSRPQLAAFIDEHGLEPCEGNQLVLKRTLATSGANRQFVNGSACPLSVLAEMGEWLVDFHGPHEHQSLLHPARQLAILDAFGGLEQLRSDFAAIVRQRAELEQEKANLIVDERTYAQQLDLLRFQVSEIESARLEADEEETLQTQYQRASNAAKLLQLSQSALEVLTEDERSLLSQAGALGRTLQELQRLDPSAAELLSLEQQTMALLQELQSGVSHYADKVELDPERLSELEERLNLVQSLKRKYGSTIAEVIAFGSSAREKLTSLENRETELARITAEISKVTKRLWEAGKELTARRAKLLPVLAKATAKQLADLGFAQSKLEIDLKTVSEADFCADPSKATLQGLDSVEFQFSPNKGEPPRPLRAIASSGELARVMLALKTVLAAQDQVPVLVFDEVDANVGGETANAVGQKMRQLAGKRQVLCITHLPQVAAPASAHFVAMKSVKDGRTVSEIGLLDAPGRVTEIARMLGGQSQEARKHAQALLRSAAG
jgi:DNA repair protein RecN (Recombination protein N)